MHGLPSKDPGMTIDWGKTSSDYAIYRSGPPESFYKRLREAGVGLPGQKILDLGTGTGVLARTFAKQGAEVSGTDISDGQIQAARELAKEQKLNVHFQVAPAEDSPFPDGSFDAITANQCWLYFDKNKMIPEVKRLLKPGGVLVTSHFSWMPRTDAIARASENLVLKYNPNWTARDWSGEIPIFPAWAKGHFVLKDGFYFDEAIPFNVDSWCGRMRACRGVGAALPADQVQKFDSEHKQMLIQMGLSDFTILHRIDAHIFAPC